VHEEEWSYIPVGGPLPLPDQPVAAFGAAASLVHPGAFCCALRCVPEKHHCIGREDTCS
jgi:lycopene epsilon-cyclase